MEMTQGIKRRTLALLYGVAGTVLLVIGAVLQLAGVQFSNDLPGFLMLLGGLVWIFAVMNIVKMRRKTDAVIGREGIRSFFLDNVILLALFVLMIVIAIIEPRFIQFKVLVDILTQSSTRMIIALGICFTLLIGGTDLSAGRIVGLAAVVSASLMQTADYPQRFFPGLPQIPVILPVLIAILVAVVFGAINGFLVSKLGLQPFIATLAVQVMAYGVCSIYFSMPPNNAQPIGGIRADFAALGQTKLFGVVPILIPIALLFALAVWFILSKTVFGKNVYAVGGNREAAAVSGVSVTKTLFLVFILAAAFYAVGGILEAARTAGASNAYGFGYELDAIAACVVGGVSLSGGVGKVRGVIIGVLIFTVIQYGLSFIGLSPYWQQVIKGVIIAAAVAIDVVKYRKKA